MIDKKKDMSCINIRMLALLTFLGALLFFSSGSVFAALDFDHFDTGFPLSGKHANTACESCHIDGVFKGTPKDCVDCHNEQIALGKNPQHIATNEQCDDCHTTFNFSKATVDHSSVIGICTDCHILPVNHIATNAMCDDCHSTLAFTPARFDHSSISTGCIDCHQKNPQHVEPTSDNCEDCHSTNSWRAKFNHSNNTASCETCHMKTKPNNHPNTSDVCGDCHRPTKWSDVTRIDHSSVTTCRNCHQDVEPKGRNHPSTNDECNACHTNAGSNWKFNHNVSANNYTCTLCHDGGVSTGKSNNHPTSSDNCEACHTINSWSGAKIDHSAATECRICHQKQEPQGRNHPSTNDECDVCHTNVGNNWKFNHTASANLYACILCHDGGVSSGKSNNHPASSDDCAACHTINDWGNVNFDHSTVTECRTCHAKQEPNGRGHPATNQECDDCHTNVGRNWSFNHSAAARTTPRCDVCHDGSVAQGLPGDHPRINPGQDCGECHSTNNWDA